MKPFIGIVKRQNLQSGKPINIWEVSTVNSNEMSKKGEYSPFLIF
jgi:hypothetical protein